MQVDVWELLDKLGIDVISSGEKEIRGECPAHDRRGSIGDWFINAENGKHQCWSCGFAGDYKSLVEAVLGVERFEAVTWLIDNGLMSAEEIDFIPEPRKDPTPERFSEAELVLYGSVPAAELKKRRIRDGAPICTGSAGTRAATTG